MQQNRQLDQIPFFFFFPRPRLFKKKAVRVVNLVESRHSDSGFTGVGNGESVEGVDDHPGLLSMLYQRTFPASLWVRRRSRQATKTLWAIRFFVFFFRFYFPLHLLSRLHGFSQTWAEFCIRIFSHCFFSFFLFLGVTLNRVCTNVCTNTGLCWRTSTVYELSD